MWSVNEKVVSANGQYRGNLKSMGNNTFEFEVSDSLGIPLWKEWVEWSDGLVAMLSDDGKVFVLINDEYSGRKPLVVVHRQGSQEAYSINAIALKPELLKARNSRLVWFENAEGAARFVYGAAGKAASVEIKTVSGEILSISL
jgi:hypothetical protein